MNIEKYSYATFNSISKNQRVCLCGGGGESANLLHRNIVCVGGEREREKKGGGGSTDSLNIFYCLIVIAKGSGYKFSQH